MDGARIVPLAPYATTGEDTKAPRRSSVFQNIRSASVAPVSDARPSRSSLLRSVKEAAIVVPFSLDRSGDIRPPLFTRNSKTLQSVEEDDDNPPDGPLPKRQAFVGPIPLPLRQPSHLVKSFTMFGFSLAPLYDHWERLQVSHCGQYSVERMLALDEYCQRTSYRRVLTVCFLTPLIPLLVVILMELVPLSPSEDKASGNYVFWSRHALTIAITVMCAEMQATSWIPELPLTLKQALVIAIGTGILTTGVELFVAEFLVFPIPFLSILGAPVLLVFLAIMARIVLGSNPVFGVQDAAFRGQRFLQIISLQMSLLLIYPAYQAVSLAVDGSWQMLTISLLPVINVILKNTLVACGSHLEDNLPELVVLTVDGFSALYSVICMRGTNSLKMVAVTVVLNVFVLVLSLHGVNRRSRAARESRSFHLMQLKRREALRTPSFLSSGRQELLSTLVVTTLKLLRAPGQLDPTVLREIRLLSGMQHKLSTANCALLQSLAARSVYSNDRRISQAISISQMKSRYASAAIEGRVFSASHFAVLTPPSSQIAQRIRAAIRGLPETALRIGSGGSRNRSNSKETGGDSKADSLPPITKLVKASSRWISDRTASPEKPPPLGPPISRLDPDTSVKLRPLVMTGSPIIGDVLSETRKKNTRAVKQSLQLLFNNEYLGLIAYIQLIISVLSLLYMPVLQALPNRIYYPSHFVLMENAQDFLDRMTMIAVLALLQLVVLCGLHTFVATRFAVSTVYQIAFVLETHWRLVEGRLLVWFIFAVQSTLLHYGADFTFQFNWINGKQ